MFDLTIPLFKAVEIPQPCVRFEYTCKINSVGFGMGREGGRGGGGAAFGRSSHIWHVSTSSDKFRCFFFLYNL